MMTYQQHVAEAERLMDVSDEIFTSRPDSARRLIAKAQVHATLALAIATRESK